MSHFGCQAKLNFIGFSTSFSQTNEEFWEILNSFKGEDMKTNFLKYCLMAVSLSVVPFASTYAADCVHKVGGLAPLSAPGSVTGGEAMRDAMLLAERDVNAAGGVLGCDLEVVITDTEGLPEKATAMMEKLITQEEWSRWEADIIAQLGGFKDVANARGIPVVFAETWNDTITGDKQKYIFRIAPLSSWARSDLAICCTGAWGEESGYRDRKY